LKLKGLKMNSKFVFKLGGRKPFPTNKDKNKKLLQQAIKLLKERRKECAVTSVDNCWSCIYENTDY
jgi:hypothetical protein